MAWDAEILAEIEEAEASRQRGNEGRARVSARRAAGKAIFAYRRVVLGKREPALAAITLLRWLQQFNGSDDPMQEAAKRLIVHVNKDHELPHDQDPLQDARLIIAFVRDAIDRHSGLR